ncbi:AMP-binding protein [Nocardia sp. NPDC059239]|uniref:AMP-binding protein n=1 Tax=unclassified Nocardia TaxID=2637762 RepID=UPI003688B533
MLEAILDVLASLGIVTVKGPVEGASWIPERFDPTNLAPNRALQVASGPAALFSDPKYARERPTMTVDNLSALTAPQILSYHASRRADHVFCDFSGDKWTYGKLHEAVNRAANGFKALGVERGQRVAYMLDNHADTMIVWLGLMRLGAIVVPINTAYKGEFLRHQIADSQTEIVVAESGYVDRVATVAGGAPFVRTVIVRGDVVPAGDLTVYSLDEVKSGSNEAVDDSDITPATTAMLMYTSGTTGPSKGCVVSHGYITTCGRSMIRCYELREDDILWISAPMYYFGCLGSAVTPTLITGSTVSIAPKFSLSDFWPAIERSKATIAMLISTMVTLVAHAPDTDVSIRCKGQLRMIQGAPLGAEEQQLFKDRFGVPHSGPAGFGITEASIVTQNRIAEPSPANSSGRRFEVFDLKIVDENGNECPAGVPGLVFVKPTQPHAMMDGYWNNPEATSRAIQDGWFNTGDIGKLDENGYFFFVDRAKDYLRKGGENISSFEMESAFLQHSAVREIAVHAVVSELSEDEIKATIVLHDGASLTEYELCRWSMDHVPAYAVPRFIEFRDELPKNMVGRVLKFQLRDEGRTATTWDRQETDLAATRRSAPVKKG